MLSAPNAAARRFALVRRFSWMIRITIVVVVLILAVKFVGGL
ncbi:MAG: hypothetical protein ACLPZM_02900 [Thermoplasmata archaeon]